MKRTVLAVVLALGATVALAVVVAGGGLDYGSRRGKPYIDVFAASSLRVAFTEYADDFKPARVRFEFGGSDTLAARIHEGINPDIYAAANTKLPDQLYHEGRFMRPVKFTANRLVLAVPSGSSQIHSLDDLARSGVAIAAGAPGVPVGSYTRQVLGGLPAGERKRILANVKSQEPDVTGIVGKLTQGAVDAGFVYATDVKATQGALRAIALPAALEPTVVYEVAVIKDTAHADEARTFVNGLRSGAGQAALRRAGFLPVPR